ncbi:general transcription factor II-I repeat domain-containing protein 2B-like [Hydra vulgaris]|uniref:general transcription factor II-I repeat domain-containing protein 2B-like n=1 Tax=Hydra vulgaris TaxID=6087 RepID=UPI0032EA5E4D
MTSACLNSVKDVLIRQCKRYFSFFITETLKQEAASARFHNIDSEELIARLRICINNYHPVATKQVDDLDDVMSDRIVSSKLYHECIDVEQQLLNDLKNCEAFSLAVDESTDIQDKPQMAVFFVSVATDGASAMAGKHLGLIVLLKSDPKYPEFIPIRCVVHRQHLAAKHFNFLIVFKSVLKIVNYIRANAKNHRQFRNFINELDLADEPSDVSFFCSGKEKNISDLAQTIFSFQNKIILFQKDLSLKKINHFPQMKEMINFNPLIQYDDNKIESYLDKLKDLQKDFQKRFKDLHELKSSLGFIVNPFLINIISNGCPIPEKMLEDISQFEMELLDLQEDQNLLMLHKTITFMEFWKIVPKVKYPQLKKIAIKFISIFGSTYTCESLFSTMKFVKSKYRANLTSEHLSE